MRPTENSEVIRKRVIAAREIQLKRFEGHHGIHCNAMISAKLQRKVCRLTDGGMAVLKTAMDRLGLSARAYDRILKVSRTIADLAGSDDIQTEHLAEAIHYRSLDRDGWAG